MESFGSSRESRPELLHPGRFIWTCSNKPNSDRPVLVLRGNPVPASFSASTSSSVSCPSSPDLSAEVQQRFAWASGRKPHPDPTRPPILVLRMVPAPALAPVTLSSFSSSSFITLSSSSSLSSTSSFSSSSCPGSPEVRSILRRHVCGKRKRVAGGHTEEPPSKRH